MFPNKDSFYSEELSTPRPNPKLEDHPLSAVRDCLFNTFAATLHIGSCFFIRNLRTHHSVMTGTHFVIHSITSVLISASNLNRFQIKSMSVLNHMSICFAVNGLIIPDYR